MACSKHGVCTLPHSMTHLYSCIPSHAQVPIRPQAPGYMICSLAAWSLLPHAAPSLDKPWIPTYDHDLCAPTTNPPEHMHTLIQLGASGPQMRETPPQDVHTSTHEEETCVSPEPLPVTPDRFPNPQQGQRSRPQNHEKNTQQDIRCDGVGHTHLGWGTHGQRTCAHTRSLRLDTQTQHSVARWVASLTRAAPQAAPAPGPVRPSLAAPAHSRGLSTASPSNKKPMCKNKTERLRYSSPFPQDSALTQVLLCNKHFHSNFKRH